MEKEESTLWVDERGRNGGKRAGRDEDETNVEKAFFWRSRFIRDFKSDLVKTRWLEGEFSRPKSFDELPANHLGPLSTETWVRVLMATVAIFFWKFGYGDSLGEPNKSYSALLDCIVLLYWSFKVFNFLHCLFTILPTLYSIINTWKLCSVAFIWMVTH